MVGDAEVTQERGLKEAPNGVSEGGKIKAAFALSSICDRIPFAGWSV